MNVQIHAKEFTASEQLTDFIRQKVEKLRQYFDHIIDVEVFLSLESKNSQVKDKVAKVKVNIPGHQLVAGESSKVFEEAIDLSIDSLKKQLTRHKEKMGSK